jgi:hypothetical protein
MDLEIFYLNLNINIMKVILTAKSLFLFLSILFLQNIYSQESALSNKDVIAMNTANISDEIMMTKISSSKCDFDLSAKGLIALKSAKISESIINTMFVASPPTETMKNEDVISLTGAKISRDIIEKKIASTPHDFDISADGLIKLTDSKVNKNIVKIMMANPRSSQSMIVKAEKETVQENVTTKSDEKIEEHKETKSESVDAKEILNSKDLANLKGGGIVNKYYRTYISQNGTTYSIGDKITLGFPTNNGKTFNYAFSEAIFSGEKQLPATFSNRTYEIRYIYFKNMGLGKKSMKTVYFKTKNVGAGDYVIIEIENAVASKEVKSSTFTEEDALAEMKKAKEKLELGLITQKEFDAVKEKMMKYIKH